MPSLDGSGQLLSPVRLGSYVPKSASPITYCLVAYETLDCPRLWLRLSYMFEIRRRTASGDEIKPGLRQRHRSNREVLKFEFYTVMDTAQPDSWHGEVRFSGQIILTTDSYASDAAAGRAAEEALADRILGLFSGGV